MIRSADVRVNMGCIDREACPALFIHNLVEWRIEDPQGKSIEKVRAISLITWMFWNSRSIEPAFPWAFIYSDDFFHIMSLNFAISSSVRFP